MGTETWCCGVRHIQMVLLLVSRVVELNLLWTLRISLLLAGRDATSNHTLFDDPYRQTVLSWNDNQKSILNNAYMTLSFIANLFGGWLTLKVNLKWILLVTVGMNTILTYVFPHICTASNYDTALTVVIVMGFLFSMKDPAIMAILGQWTPTTELGRTVPLVYNTMTISHFSLMFLYQFIKDSPAAWTSIFYLMGNLGVLWCVGWYTFGFQEPDKCFYVSLRERNYIAGNIPMNTFGRKPVEIPWKRMFKSVSFWGVLLSVVMFRWLLMMAMYSALIMAFVYSIGIDMDFAFYLVYFCVLIMVPIMQWGLGCASDKMLLKSKHPTRFARKTCNSIGFWGTSVALLFLAYDLPAYGQVGFCLAYCHFASTSYLSGQLNFFDIDRAMTGFVYGLVNFFALIPIAYINSMYPPIFKSQKTLDQEVQDDFNNLWLSGALMAFFGNFFYICMATDEKNPMVTVAPLASRQSNAK